MSIGIFISFRINLEDHNSNKGRWKTLVLIYHTGICIGMPILLGLTIRAVKKKKPAPKIPHEPMFHDDSNFDQVEENENDISDNKHHSNPQIHKESAEKKAPNIPQGPMFFNDSNLDREENENAIYVISGNDQRHPFSPQIQESSL